MLFIFIVIITEEPITNKSLHNKFNNIEDNLNKRINLLYDAILKTESISTKFEYKELIANKDNLPFELLNNHIKESKVNYQRNLSTIINNYNHTCDDFGEEMIQLLINYVKK